MSTLTSESIVSVENYAELKNMMLSKDKASAVMALTIMEQSDYEKSEVYLLTLFKETYVPLFASTGCAHKENEYPVLFQKVAKTLTDEDTTLASLSFKKVYEVALERDNKEELDFMLKILKGEIVTMFTEFGLTFLDLIDIELKVKKVKEVVYE